MNASFVASWGSPGMRHGAAAPTMPAASRLPCGARVSRGLAELASLKQLRALIRETLRSSAQPEGIWGRAFAALGSGTAHTPQQARAPQVAP